MKKLLVVLVLLSVYAYGQCMTPISTRVGVKFGLNPGTYDPGGGATSFSGLGMHVGFGMGTDIFNLIAIDMTPQYRSTSYSRDELLGTRTYSFSNLYFPIFLALKGGMIPLISPYIGFGIGINVPASGREKFTFGDGSSSWENELGTGTTAFLIVGGGAEIKLAKFRISPEFTANLQPTEEENVANYTDYHISLGFYYSP